MDKLKFMTLQQIADILQLDNMTIYRYVKRGDIKALKFGRKFRVYEKDFLAFLEKARVSAKESNAKHKSCIVHSPGKRTRKASATNKTVSKKVKRTRNAIIRRKK